MRKTIEADLDAEPEAVVEVLGDLGRYPAWLDLVSHALPAPAEPADQGPAWMVTLKAKVGPFARSKRLRMVRTKCTNGHLRFERSETDGRDHAAWVLDATVSADRPCHVVVELSYDGGLWSAPLEAILGNQATNAIPKLEAIVGT